MNLTDADLDKLANAVASRLNPTSYITEQVLGPPISTDPKDLQPTVEPDLTHQGNSFEKLFNLDASRETSAPDDFMILSKQIYGTENPCILDVRDEPIVLHKSASTALTKRRGKAAQKFEEALAALFKNHPEELEEARALIDDTLHRERVAALAA